MLNLHRYKNAYSNSIVIRREPGRDGKIVRDHSQDDQVALGEIGSLPR